MDFSYELKRDGIVDKDIDSAILAIKENMSDSNPFNVRSTYSNLCQKVQVFHDPLGFMLYVSAHILRPEVERIEISETKLLPGHVN